MELEPGGSLQSDRQESPSGTRWLKGYYMASKHAACDVGVGDVARSSTTDRPTDRASERTLRLFGHSGTARRVQIVISRRIRSSFATHEFVVLFSFPRGPCMIVPTPCVCGGRRDPNYTWFIFFAVRSTYCCAVKTSDNCNRIERLISAQKRSR